MMELHRTERNLYADEIEDRLKMMVVAYRTIVHSGLPDQNEQEKGAVLPHIRESGKVISGKKEIESWLEELDRELRQQRSVSGDGCYIDPETGKIC